MQEEIVKLCYVGTDNPIVQAYGGFTITYSEHKDADSKRTVFVADAPFHIADKVAQRSRLYIVLDPKTMKMRRSGETLSQYLVRQGPQLTQALRHPAMPSEMVPNRNFQFENTSAVLNNVTDQARRMLQQTQEECRRMLADARASVDKYYELMPESARPKGAVDLPDGAEVGLAPREFVDLDLGLGEGVQTPVAPAAEEFAGAPSRVGSDVPTPKRRRSNR